MKNNFIAISRERERSRDRAKHQEEIEEGEVLKQKEEENAEDNH